MAYTVEQLSDLEEIRRVIFQYCRAVDRRDWDLLRACFHPDALDDHGTGDLTVDEFVDSVRARHEGDGLPQSMHAVHNLLVELAGEAAVAETYFTSTQHKRLDMPASYVLHNLDPAELKGGDLLVTRTDGRYVDRFERREGAGWRIAHRYVVVETARHRVADQHTGTRGSWRLSSRGADDVLHAVRSEVLGSAARAGLDAAHS